MLGPGYRYLRVQDPSEVANRIAGQVVDRKRAVGIADGTSGLVRAYVDCTRRLHAERFCGNDPSLRCRRR